MQKKMVHVLLALIAYAAVLYPAWVWYEQRSLGPETDWLLTLFPLFGMLAFSLMWLHIVGKPFKPWLERYIDFERFVTVTSLLVLGLLILHPLLFLLWLGWERLPAFFTSGFSAVFVWLGVIAWVLFIGYDVAKLIKERSWVQRYWRLIQFLATAPFFLVLIHSLNLGSELQQGPLRLVWWFYGATALLATVYTYGLQRS